MAAVVVLGQGERRKIERGNVYERRECGMEGRRGKGNIEKQGRGHRREERKRKDRKKGLGD